MNPWSRRHCRLTPAARRQLFLGLVQLEAREAPTGGFEPIDGVGNNVTHKTWGSTGTDLIRVSPVAYADGISTPSLPNAPSARAVSNMLNDQTDPANPAQDYDVLNKQNLTDFGYVFGQFMDHDMDLTPDGGASMPIAVPPGDPIGPNSLPFTRSQFDPATGTGKANPRQQINADTSYLDLSQVYGSDAGTADALRTHVGGQLKTSGGNMLPLNNTTYFTAQQLATINKAVGGMANAGPAPTSALAVTGDTRGNENVELTALQTLFLRNHNRIAAQLQTAHPSWSDEQLYQEARKINIAQYQSIIYNEWIPSVLGGKALTAYKGYNPNVNAAISSEFSTVGFRFGHSLLDNDIERHQNNGTDLNIAGGSDISLAEDFFDPYMLNPSGLTDPYTGLTSTDIGPVLKADADGISQETDLLAVRNVRDLLFGNGGGGEDLMARDVQRARDHGLPDYNTMRAAYGLPVVTSFSQISSDPAVQQKFAQTFSDVNHIDAFEGGLAEDHVAGSDVGPLFQAIMADQFSRLRAGDRFFYLNENWTQEESRVFGQANTLAKVIEANTNITNLQSNVFVFSATISGTASVPGRPVRGHASPPTPVAGATVQLIDDNNVVIASVVTDAQGRYRFDQSTGMSSTGSYTVRLVAPSGYTVVSRDLVTDLISRGNDNDAINFTLTGGSSHFMTDSLTSDAVDNVGDALPDAGRKGVLG
jgi:hypothetical protein